MLILVFQNRPMAAPAQLRAVQVLVVGWPSAARSRTISYFDSGGGVQRTVGVIRLPTFAR